MQDPIDLPLTATLPDLSGEVAIVTGTTSGLGRRFALVLAKAGAKVVVTGRRIDRLEDLASRLAERGLTSLPLALDVTDEADIVRVVKEAEERLGPVTLLVNNAGINKEGLVMDLATAEFDALMTTNVRGAFLMAREVGRRMIAAKRAGRIVNIASIGAFRVLPGLSAYCMSKAALAMMTKGLAREWARHHVAVNALCPGYVTTELNDAWFRSEAGQKQVQGFPRRRLGKEEDLDATLLLLCSRHADFITGALFTVDDGQILA